MTSPYFTCLCFICTWTIIIHRLIPKKHTHLPLTSPRSSLGQECKSGFISWAHRVGFNVQLMWCVEKGPKWQGAGRGHHGQWRSLLPFCGAVGSGGPPYNVLHALVWVNTCCGRCRSLLFETTVSSASDSLLAEPKANSDKSAILLWNGFAGTSLFPSSTVFFSNNLGSPHSENTAVVIYRRLRSLCLRGLRGFKSDTPFTSLREAF